MPLPGKKSLSFVVFALQAGEFLRSIVGRGTSDGRVSASIEVGTLPETNIAPENGGWNTSFLLGRPTFRGELLVSGRVVDLMISNDFVHPRIAGYLPAMPCHPW